ncbi:MAG TPA: tRNA (N6-isopentenyl adenosine(37)-C2)-methylthiotransferase MiaB [Chthoniobacteraceae bacterium]|jgi:tRNA-2-methylthio-N6-dimethylallyladenosine synthase|nr:tRNA (N6-isopentenyl adenosine(37)-C2)-methylthiotransferase MiaB [Chthoniobacteraceae bacterium]
MPRVYIKTYGCQMNERDSEQVAQMLIARGYEMTGSEHDADVVLLNTCSVRDMAEQKALGKMGMLSRLRQARPHMVFGFLGCMAQSRGEELVRDIGHVDLVAGTQKFHRVAEYVDEIFARRTHGSMDDPRFSIVDTGEEAGSQETIRDHRLEPDQVTAFVSIMQGCNMHCTFCIVPSTRGPERSRGIAEIVDEVRGLAARGVREVTLLGQIVNLYGRHEFAKVDGKSPFVQLLEAVHEVEGIERIRFTSPHPIGYREDLIEASARLPKLAEHVHLPLQSGASSILRAMHRTYTPEKYLELVRRIREARPDMAITTDVIVGFPGETDEDYSATRELVREAAFDNAFIFRYSRRRDTPAADLPGQVEESVKEARNQDLLTVVNDLARAKNAALVGQTVEILCEGVSKSNADRLMGRTRGNKIVIFEGGPRHIGQLFDVNITRVTGFSLYGDPAILH